MPVLVFDVGLPCWARVFGTFPVTIATYVTYVVRAWRIFIFYEMQALKIDDARKDAHDTPTDIPVDGIQDKEDTQPPLPNQRLIQLYSYCTDRNMFWLACGVSLLCGFTMWIPFMVIGKYDSGSNGTEICSEAMGSYYAMLANIGMSNTCRKLKDPLVSQVPQALERKNSRHSKYLYQNALYFKKRSFAVFA